MGEQRCQSDVPAPPPSCLATFGPLISLATSNANDVPGHRPIIADTTPGNIASSRCFNYQDFSHSRLCFASLFKKMILKWLNFILSFLIGNIVSVHPQPCQGKALTRWPSSALPLLPLPFVFVFVSIYLSSASLFNFMALFLSNLNYGLHHSSYSSIHLKYQHFSYSA